MIVTSEGKDGVVAHFVEDLVLEGTLEARGKTGDAGQGAPRPGADQGRVGGAGRTARPGSRGRLRGARAVRRRGRGRGAAARRPGAADRRAGDDGEGAGRSAAARCCAPSRCRPTRSAPTASSTSSRCPTPTTRTCCKVKGMVEKPKAEDAPSTVSPPPAATCWTGRSSTRCAASTAAPAARSSSTDAIALLIDEGHPVHVVVHRGSRHDLGNPGGYLKAAVDFALDRDDYGPDLRRWLVARLGLTGKTGQLDAVGRRCATAGSRQKGALCVRWRSSRPG